jgi:hypothetical protein
MKSIHRFLVPAMTFAFTFTVFASEAFARRWSGGTGGDTGGGTIDTSVPEIGAGSAAAAIALISGAGYLLRERFFSKNTDKKE